MHSRVMCIGVDSTHWLKHGGWRRNRITCTLLPSPMDAHLSFPYAPSRSRLVVLLALSVIGFLWMFSLSVTNDRGLIYRAIALSPRFATVLYAVMAAVCLLAVVCWGLLLTGRRHARRIVVSTVGVLAPVWRSWRLSEEERLVPLNTISDLCVQVTPYGSTLRVVHDTGKLDIASAMFESKESFPRLVTALSKMTGLEPTQDLLRMYGWRRRRSRAHNRERSGR